MLAAVSPKGDLADSDQCALHNSSPGIAKSSRTCPNRTDTLASGWSYLLDRPDSIRTNGFGSMTQPPVYFGKMILAPRPSL